MANTKSTKKRARTNEIRRQRNVARRSDVKTACKKVEEALKVQDTTRAAELLRSAEAKVSRAAGKKVFKKNKAARIISKLAKKVSSAVRAQK